MMKRTLCTMAGAALLLAGAASLALAQTPGYAYQPGYGAAPAYGQPAYGQPAYGQPAYGTAYRPACGGWGPPPAPPSHTAPGALARGLPAPPTRPPNPRNTPPTRRLPP